MKLIQSILALCTLGISGIVLAQSPPASCIPITAVPLVITVSGSYCLTQHVATTRTAITVTADDVTIDLNGYSIRYTGSPRSITFGINRYADATAPDLWNVTIRNGTISNFYDGISLHKVSNVLIENVRIQGDATRAVGGIDLYNARASVIVRNNQIANVYWGILVREVPGAVVENNVVQLVGTNGRQVGISLEFAGSAGTLVRQNSIRNISGPYGTGIISYTTVPDATLLDNTISNFRNGISANTVGVKYRNNVVTATTFPYSGGTDIGGND
jgi:nitrous oxidase accessory protein NosD